MAYNVSEGYREQVYSGEALYDCRLKINNVQVPNSQIQTIKISSPIIDTTTESGSMFHIGTFISQKLEIKFKNLDGLTLTNNPLIELEIGLYVNNAYEYVPIGKYLIDELAENYQKTCTIECMDFALKFKSALDISKLFDHIDTIDNEEIKWMYAKDLFEAICEYYGVTVGTYPNVNNNKKIYFYDSTISGKEYIMMLAELFGGNAKMQRDGSCSIIPLKNYTNIEINALKSKKFELGDTYELTRVCFDNGKLKFQAGGNVITVDELPTADISLTSYYYLTTDMKYYIYTNEEWQETTNMKNTLYLKTDNMFISQQADVTNIYNAVQGFSVTNLTCENRMDLSLDCWDIVKYVTENGVYYNTFYDNTTIFNGVAMGTVKVNLPIKTKEETTNIIMSNEKATIRTMRTTVNEQEGSITTVITKVNGQNRKIATIEESVEELRREISNVTGMVMTSDSSTGVVEFEDVTNASEVISLKCYPNATSITYLYPRSESYPFYPSTDLYPKDRHIRFHNNTTNEDIYYELPDDLLYYNASNYDIFSFDLESDSCKIEKKCKYNANGSVSLLATPTVNTYSTPHIELTEGVYTVYINGYTGYMQVTLMAKNIYTDQFYTKVESNSLISQTATNINLSVDQKLSNYSTTKQMNAAIDIKAGEINSVVSTKVGNDEVISSINQTSEQIKINANKVNLSGYVTVSSLGSGGTTAIDGSRITTGTISANRLDLSGVLTVGAAAETYETQTHASSTYASNTSLAAGTTEIKGDCIKTGVIQSSNYSANTRGTKINLSDGSIDTKNFKVSSTGTITATNATISGNITATSGNIGGCLISDGQISINGQYITQNTMAGNRLTNNSIENQKLYSVSPSKFISGTATKSNVDSFILETNVGYLKCGNGVSHPYVSALNIAYGGGGLSFRNGTVVGNVGSEIGNIQMDTSGGENVMRFTSAGGQNFQNGTLKILPRSWN